MDVGTVNLHRVAVHSADLRPQMLQDFQAHGHIGDLRQIFNPADAVHQQSGRNNRNSGILRAADLYFTKQGLSTLYNILCQNLTLFSRIIFCGGQPSH